MVDTTHFKPLERSGSIKRKEVNPDLQEERDKLAFNKDDVENCLLNTKATAYYKEVAKMMRENPEIVPTHHFFNMDREAQMKHWWQLMNKLAKVDANFFIVDAESKTHAWTCMYPGINPVLLHVGMFLSSIQNLASEEQRLAWETPTRRMEMVGCYAQTELGHGSNVAGLETTATLDMKTDEWIIHSPTISSAKYWPGSLGLWANYAIVFAQCMVGETKCGVIPFLVQIRTKPDHNFMPGVKIGDLGAKLGYNSKDNGWCLFNQVRIPRTNMLSRFLYITKEGDLEMRGNPKALYATMVNIRHQIVCLAGYSLKKALLIGVRYAACRRQMSTIPGQKIERKLLDYQSHMFKFGPALAESYCMIGMGSEIERLYAMLLEEIKVQKFKTLDVLHHLTSGFKALFSQMAYDGIEMVRQNCGGAGYSVASGLVQIWSDYSPVPTYEGDNTVLAQQNMNYFDKIFSKIKKNQPHHHLFEYLGKIDHWLTLKNEATTVEQFLDLGHLDRALCIRAAYRVKEFHQNMAESKEPHKKNRINEIFAQDIVKMSRSHMLYLCFLQYKRRIKRFEFKDERTKNILLLLAKVFALKQLTLDCSPLYETGFFSKNSDKLLNEAFKVALKELRPHMVNLVELNFDSLIDGTHMSAIGNEYGDIYEEQLDRAMKGGLNNINQNHNKPEYFDELVLPVYNQSYLAKL